METKHHIENDLLTIKKIKSRGSIMTSNTYFLADSIQSITQNNIANVKIYSEMTDYAEKAKCEAQENYTGKSWIATDSFDEAVGTFERWIKEYNSSIELEFEQM